MTDLSRNLLAAAREGLAPGDEVAARVRAKVAAAVAAGAASTAAVTAQAASTSPAEAPTAASTPPAPATPSVASSVTASTATTATRSAAVLAVKLGVPLLVLGVAVTALLVARRAPRVEAPRIVTTAPVYDEPHGSVRIAATDVPAAPERAAPDEKAKPVQPVSTASPSELARATEPSADEPATLSREVELIDRAMLALRRGQPTAALAAIEQFDADTRGRGQMAEDAAAIEIEARCQLRQDVTAKLEAFDRKWPSSAQRERLHTACVGH